MIYIEKMLLCFINKKASKIGYLLITPKSAQQNENQEKLKLQKLQIS